MPKPRPAPMLPSDTTGYFNLLGRCIEAPDKATLVALVEEAVAFEGGRFVEDFRHEWWNRWLHLGLPLSEAPKWPKPQIAAHDGASSTPDATT